MTIQYFWEGGDEQVKLLEGKRDNIKVLWGGGRGPKGQCVTNLSPIVDNLRIRPFLNMNNFSYNIY